MARTCRRPAEEEVPDFLRCRRSDGRQWRCYRRALPNVSFCALHHIQARRRQDKQPVPDSLKLHRKHKKIKTSKRDREAGHDKGKRNNSEGILVDLVRILFQRRKDHKIRRKKEAAAAAAPLSGGLKEVVLALKVTSFEPAKAPNVPPPLEPSNALNVLPLPSTTRTPKVQPLPSGKDLPDHLRCRRNDGRQWRCRRPAMEDHYFCELHHIQAFRRQNKLEVPDHLKLKRGRPARCFDAQAIASDNSALKKRLKRKKEDETAGKEDKKKRRRREIEGLLVEVARMVLQRQMERREKKEAGERDRYKALLPKMEVRRDLPNGLMAISPVVSTEHSSNPVGEHLDRKVGMLDTNTFLQWCFRSKNLEKPPMGTLKVLPNIKKNVNLGKRQKRICHHCNNSNLGRLIRCMSCQKVFFCKNCAKKWYLDMSESDLRTACPVCLRKCRCSICPSRKPQDDLHGFL